MSTPVFQIFNTALTNQLVADDDIGDYPIFQLLQRYKCPIVVLLTLHFGQARQLGGITMMVWMGATGLFRSLTTVLKVASVPSGKAGHVFWYIPSMVEGNRPALIGKSLGFDLDVGPVLLPVVRGDYVDARDIAGKGRGVGTSPIEFGRNVMLSSASYLVRLSHGSPLTRCKSYVDVSLGLAGRVSLPLPGGVLHQNRDFCIKWGVLHQSPRRLDTGVAIC